MGRQTDQLDMYIHICMQTPLMCCLATYISGSLSVQNLVCNTLLYSSHSLKIYLDCSIREILAIITGHHI